MASTLKKFNIREGLSVGSPAVDVIDSQTNITGKTLTATDFFIYPTYTVSELTAITGQAGWCVAVGDSSPGGKLAYWDTTNTRWSYVSDDSGL